MIKKFRWIWKPILALLEKKTRILTSVRVLKMTSFVFSLLCLLLFICLFVCLFCFLAFTSDSIIQFEKKSLETILLFCLGQQRRHSTFNFPSITDVSITGAGRAHPFEDSFRKLWREFDKRSGLGCSKAGQRYLPNKSLSSG